MNSIVRTTLIASAVALVAAIAVPASASALPVASKAGIISPDGGMVGPGQTYTGHFPGGAAGSSVILYAAAISGTPCDGTQIGSGFLDADGNFSISATGVFSDGLVLVEACTNSASGVKVYTMSNPFEITTPSLQETLDVKSPTIAGVGNPGDTVTVTDADGELMGEATVGDDGNWSVSLKGLKQGRPTVTLTQKLALEQNKLITRELLVVDGNEGLPLLDPSIGASAVLLALGVGAFVVRRRRTATV